MRSKLSIAKTAENVFCIAYLLFDFVAAMIFFNHTSYLSSLFGWLTLVLGSGDAFHLVPRVLATFYGDTPKCKWFTGLGLLVSSITMTIYYLILFTIWKILFPDIVYPHVISWIIWICAGVRIALCLLPQNNWFEGGNQKWGIYRNLPFVILGICMIYLFILSGFWQMALAIALSFACYIPVVLYAKTKPATGMLMIPKTLAYIWMIVLGFGLVFRV